MDISYLIEGVFKYMIELRQLHAHEYQAAINLSDKTFRNANQKSMGDAFPSIFSPYMISQSFGAFYEGELVSFMGLVPSVIRIGEAKLRVYSLGSVCTAEEHRKKGIASQLLERVFQFIDASEASLLLVSGDRSLYTRVNCCHYGSVTRFNLRNRVQEVNENEIREMRAEDLFQINNIGQQRLVCYEQSIIDLQTLIHAEAYASCFNLSHKTIILKKDDIITSFVVIGIPDKDSTQQKAKAIEWAGHPNEIVKLLSNAMEAYKLEEIEIHIPWHEDELVGELKGNFYSKEKNQGTVYIVNAERLLHQLQPYIKNDSIQFRPTGADTIDVTIFNRSKTIYLKEFLSLLFDAEPSDSEIIKLQKETGGAFPIPFPYTAGLNYV